VYGHGLNSSSSHNREEGKGVGGLGEGTLGAGGHRREAVVALPREPREWTIFASDFRASAAMNSIFANDPLRALGNVPSSQTSSEISAKISVMGH